MVWVFALCKRVKKFQFCPQGYSRVYCHQQPQPSDSNSFDSGQDQPIVCAVCFNGYNFYGPDCTTDGKLITQIEDEENKEDKSTPKLEDEVEDGESTQEPDETDSEIVTLKLLPFKGDQPPNSNPVEREVDNTSLLWLGIGGLISLPFIIVIANGVYKWDIILETKIQLVMLMVIGDTQFFLCFFCNFFLQAAPQHVDKNPGSSPNVQHLKDICCLNRYYHEYFCDEYRMNIYS